MRDAGEKDDLDLERLADKDAVAEYQPLTPDEVLEQEELDKEAHRGGRLFLIRWIRRRRRRLCATKWTGSLLRLGPSEWEGGKARLEMRVSRAYRKMRQQVPPDLRQPLDSRVSRRKFGICEEEIQEVEVGFMQFTEADGACPVLPDQVNRYHWGFEYPSKATGNEAEIVAVFRRARNAIGLVCGAWVAGYREGMRCSCGAGSSLGG